MFRDIADVLVEGRCPPAAYNRLDSTRAGLDRQRAEKPTDARRFSPGLSMINKKHANTDRPDEPKDDLRTLEPGAWQAEDWRRLERHHHHRLVSDQPTEGDRRAGRKQH